MLWVNLLKELDNNTIYENKDGFQKLRMGFEQTRSTLTKME